MSLQKQSAAGGSFSFHVRQLDDTGSPQATMNDVALVYVGNRPAPTGRWPSSLLFFLLRIARNPNLPPEEREAWLVQIFVKFFSCPIDPRRWPFVEPMIVERAREHGTTPFYEVAIATIAALGMIERVTSSPDYPAESDIRRQVNEIVTADFLGSEWRRAATTNRAGPAEIQSAEDVIDVTADFENRIVLRQYGEELISRAALRPRELEVLKAIAEDQTLAEWARSMGLHESTARTHLWHARKKLRKVIEHLS
jgi:DNA-binding CsgD family transcriptional regulator